MSLVSAICLFIALSALGIALIIIDTGRKEKMIFREAWEDMTNER